MRIICPQLGSEHRLMLRWTVKSSGKLTNQFLILKRSTQMVGVVTGLELVLVSVLVQHTYTQTYHFPMQRMHSILLGARMDPFVRFINFVPFPSTEIIMHNHALALPHTLPPFRWCTRCANFSSSDHVDHPKTEDTTHFSYISHNPPA